MITIFTDSDKPISQKNYDDIILNLNFFSLLCTCGNIGHLGIHGYYRRGIKVEDHKIKLRICRVKCDICKVTHALLLSFIVPYSQTPLECQLSIIKTYEEKGQSTASKDYESIMEETPSLDEGDIRRIIKNYCFHWRQRIICAGISFDSLSLSYNRLLTVCFKLFKRQFMQIKRTPNILFPNTT